MTCAQVLNWTQWSGCGWSLHSEHLLKFKQAVWNVVNYLFEDAKNGNNDVNRSFLWDTGGHMCTLLLCTIMYSLYSFTYLLFLLYIYHIHIVNVVVYLCVLYCSVQCSELLLHCTAGLRCSAVRTNHCVQWPSSKANHY